MIKAWTNGADTSMYVFKINDQRGEELISLIFHVDWVVDFQIEIEGEGIQ